VLALLARRLHTGRGGHVEISQAEVMLSHLATEIAGTALGLPGIEQAPDAPWGVFPAAGEDEWCVVTVRDDADWRALCGVTGEPETAGATRAERLADEAAIEAHLAQWLAGRDPQGAAQTLQAAGVPAAPMLRVFQQPEYP